MRINVQQHGSVYFDRKPPPTLGMGSINTSKISFFRTWSCCISNFRESRMQQHGSKYFASRPSYLPTLGMGSVVQNSTFLEHGYVAYQIKENQECTNIVANILPTDPLPHRPWVWGQYVKIQLFRTWSCCISNNENQECSNMVATIFPSDPPQPLGMGQ